MSREIQNLLNDLCVDLGFCIPAQDQAKIIGAENWEADEFACAVLTAEEIDPEEEIRWRREIRNRFIEKFGSDTFKTKSS